LTKIKKPTKNTEQQEESTEVNPLEEIVDQIQEELNIGQKEEPIFEEAQEYYPDQEPEYEYSKASNEFQDLEVDSVNEGQVEGSDMAENWDDQQYDELYDQLANGDEGSYLQTFAEQSKLQFTPKYQTEYIPFVEIHFSYDNQSDW